MIEMIGAGWIRFVFQHAVESPVYLVGDFNDWDETSHRMDRQGDGSHQILLKLAPGEYEFKYKSGCVWHNDSAAHKYVQNCWGSENSVVVVPVHDESGDDDAGAGPAEADEARPAGNAGQVFHRGP